MVPGAETFPAQQPEKAVWQLAFYAPLEETKGIKIFCDAVEQLPRTVLDRPGFEVGAPEGACGSSQGLRVPGLRMSCLRVSLAPITAAAWHEELCISPANACRLFRSVLSGHICLL